MSSRSSGSDETFAKLLGQFLRDLLVLASGFHEFLQTLRGILLLQFAEEIDELVHAAIGLLRAALQEIKELRVVAEEFADGEHGGSESERPVP